MGDLILYIQQSWKKFWCIHKYTWKGKLDFRYESCNKCGKLKI